MRTLLVGVTTLAALATACSTNGPCPARGCPQCGRGFDVPSPPTSISTTGPCDVVPWGASDVDASTASSYFLAYAADASGTCTVTITVGTRTSTTIEHLTAPTDRCACCPTDDGASIDLSAYGDAGP